jgi:hypothetical protein
MVLALATNPLIHRITFIYPRNNAAATPAIIELRLEPLFDLTDATEINLLEIHIGHKFNLTAVTIINIMLLTQVDVITMEQTEIYNKFTD